VHAAPVVALTGPRRAGKAALARREFPALSYVNLADHADRARARRDPAAFLGSLRGRAILDEAHRAPELFSALEHATQLLLLAPVQLALPACPELHLYSPSLAERCARPPTALDLLARYAQPAAAPPAISLDTLLSNSGPRDEASLEHDTRTLIGLHDADRFLAFVQLAAAASGRVVDQSRWAAECGVTHTTIARWLAALERTFHIVQPRAYGESFGRRLVRRRKLYFLHPAWVPPGDRFEAWGTAEAVKSLAHTGQPVSLAHWVTASGQQTGIIVPMETGPLAISFTRLPTAPPALLGAARKWRSLAPHHSSCVFVAGSGSSPSDVTVHPWWRL